MHARLPAGDGGNCAADCHSHGSEGRTLLWSALCWADDQRWKGVPPIFVQPLVGLLPISLYWLNVERNLIVVNQAPNLLFLVHLLNEHEIAMSLHWKCGHRPEASPVMS